MGFLVFEFSGKMKLGKSVLACGQLLIQRSHGSGERTNVEAINDIYVLCLVQL